MRQGSLRKLTVGSIIQKYGVAHVSVKAKGSKYLTLKIPDEVLESIKVYRRSLQSSSTPDAPLFLSMKPGPAGPKPMAAHEVRDLVKRYAKKALIRKVVTPHTLRHSAFSIELQNGATIAEISKQAGHSSLAVTGRYLHCLGSQAVDRNPLFSKQLIG